MEEGNRNPTYGIGDRGSTIKLLPHLFYVLSIAHILQFVKSFLDFIFSNKRRSAQPLCKKERRRFQNETQKNEQKVENKQRRTVSYKLYQLTKQWEHILLLIVT